MKIHSRTMTLQKAASEFGIFWARMNFKTFEDGYLAWSIIDRFWIDASIKGWSLKEAAKAWESTGAASQVLSAGNELARIATESELTFGEIGVVLVRTRETDLKYHIRVERHPEDSSKPGDIA